MKIIRYKSAQGAAVGFVKGERAVAAADLPVAYATVRAIMDADAAAYAALRDAVEAATPTLVLAELQLLAPVERPGKYLGIGMNYGKHAEEAEKLGVPKPTQQLWFNKQVTCVSGPYDAIDPGVTEKLDYEVELGVVIGREAKGVSADEALAHVFGYFVANDVSARDWQFHSQTITLGKSFDTHGPIGPWIVTADELTDPQTLTVRSLVNGEVRQQGHTSDMIFPIAQQIAYLSTAFTLEPGDLLATGTPEGVGIAMNPPQFLQPGDVVRCEVDGIGAIENRVVPASGR